MRLMNFNNEDFTQIKSAHVSRGILFEDEGFSTTANVDFLAGKTPSPPEFKRVRDISDSAVLKADGPPNAICRGSISNINLILALSLVAERTKLLEGLFPDLKEMNDLRNVKNYSGAFRIRFWIDGAFVFVVVDDVLPMINGKLICPHSSNPNEFWPSLLVKAYAKLLGGYEHLENLRLEDALQDLTGCVLDTTNFQEMTGANDLRRIGMFETLTQAINEGSIVLLCTKSDLVTESTNDKTLNNGIASTNEDNSEGSIDELCAPRHLGTIDPVTGLCSNYAYMLTKTCLVPQDSSAMGTVLSALKFTQEAPKNRLLRLRSVLTVQPRTASFGEWKGPYSEFSHEWEELSVRDRSRIGLVVSTEAEFWMPLSAMFTYFAGAIIARLPKTGIFAAWTLAEYNGIWRADNSGGGLNFRNSFLLNPQDFYSSAMCLKDRTVNNGIEQRVRSIAKKRKKPRLPIAFNSVRGADFAHWFITGSQLIVVFWSQALNTSHAGIELGKNCKYLFEMTKDTPEEVLISLNRKYTWDPGTQKIVDEPSPPAIGFALLKVESNRNVRVHLLSTCSLIDAHAPKTHRAVFGRYKLYRGRYVLVPFLQEPQQEADYYLRLFFPRNLPNRELIYDKPPKGAFEFFTGSPVIITRIELIRGANLGSLKPKTFGMTPPSSPYCKVICEDSSCTGRTIIENSNPTWNEAFIFYRAKPTKQPIRIEVYNKQTFGKDEFLGEGVLNAPESTGNDDFEVNLYTKMGNNMERARLKGILYVSLATVDFANFMGL
ncbi:hypothetical protein Aperf_G00000091997 [Anoplocephala perfoliata]